MTAYQQDELDLFGDPDAPEVPSLPLCLLGSQARGIAARTAEFEAWEKQHGSFGSLLRAHAWTLQIGGAPGTLTDRCQAAVLSVDLRQNLKHPVEGLECDCTGADEYLYRGACRCCDWEGPPRPGLAAENLATEDVLDHAWPGWRDLPVVARPPDGRGTESTGNRKRDEARDRWIAHVSALYPAGWLEAGGPIRTLRKGPYGHRHVPGATPFGGHDIGVPDGETVT
jgi:hypothetical protein